MTAFLRRVRGRDEGGFTLLEVIITTALLSLALAGFLGSLGSSQEVSSFTETRTRALDDMRVAAATFAREARQGTAASSTPTSIILSTYLGGSTAILTPTQVTWSLAVPAGGSTVDLIREVTTATPRDLPPLVLGAGGSEFRYDATTKTVTMILVTRPSPKHLPVRLETEVTLRNAPA